MFRSFIYLDEEKMYTYWRQIIGANKAQPKTMTQKKAAGITADLSRIGMNASAETTVDSEFNQDVSFDYDQFESALSSLNGEEYFDLVMSDDYDISTIPAMRLFRICSNIVIPEEFDMVPLIERFKPLLFESLNTRTDQEQTLIKDVLGNTDTDIPLVAELDDITLAGKLHTKYLKESYEELEDYSEQDAIMLCKVVSMSQKEVVDIYDPLKDFIKLPRAMRRQPNVDGKDIGLEKIRVPGPVLKVEVIAIYK